MHRLEIDEPERLVQRRQREDVGRGQQLELGLVGDEAAKLHPRRRGPSSRAWACEGGLLRPIADDQQMHVVAAERAAER